MESYHRAVYVTADGREFYDEKEALQHEKDLEQSANILIKRSNHFKLIDIPFDHFLYNKARIVYIALIEDQQGIEEINFVCQVKEITNAGSSIEFNTPGKFIVIGNDDLYYLRIEDISFYRDIDVMIRDFISNYSK